MKRITSIKWLDTHTWGIRGFNPGGKANYNGYQFPRLGTWAEAPDWNDKPQCGGGFHGMTPQFNGHGFYGSQLALIEYKGECVSLDGDKCKWRRIRRVPCSRRVLAEALRRCRVRVVERDGEPPVTKGLAVVFGSTVTVEGGRCYAYSGSTVTVEDGWCDAYSGSTVTVEGGWCAVYDSATATIQGGWCVVYDSATVTGNEAYIVWIRGRP